MNVKIVATGSAGNFNVIDDVIAIDCGVPAKILSKHDFEFLLVSHAHSDHLHPTAVKWLAINNPQLLKHGFFGVDEVCAKTVQHTGYSSLNGPVTYGDKIKLHTSKGVYKVSFIKLFHDVANAGFIVESPLGKRLVHATDTVSLESFKNTGKYDFLMVEGNYDDDLLLAGLADEDTHSRARQNLRHLPNSKFIDFVQKHSRDKSMVWQLHLSRTFGKVLDSSVHPNIQNFYDSKGVGVYGI